MHTVTYEEYLGRGLQAEELLFSFLRLGTVDKF
jgi:hypothetical protein